MARKLQSDKWLFLATLALVCVSIVMVYSASAVMALERFQLPYHYVIRQAMWALFGLAVLVPGIAVGIRRLHDIGKPGIMILIGLILCVGWIILLVWAAQDSQRGSNEYGPSEKYPAG